eukprot:941139-Pyramimonas_sp.AAC.1
MAEQDRGIMRWRARRMRRRSRRMRPHASRSRLFSSFFLASISCFEKPRARMRASVAATWAPSDSPLPPPPPPP